MYIIVGDYICNALEPYTNYASPLALALEYSSGRKKEVV